MIALEQPAAKVPTRINPSEALIKSIWQRHRQGIVAVYIYLAFLCAAARLASSLMSTADYFFTISVVDAPLLFAFVYLVGTFTGAGADIVSSRSGFPTHYNLLPIKTSTMVNVLALFGVTALTLTWCAVDTLILHPIGQSIQLVGALPTLAAGIMLLQTVVWIPVGVPFVRIPLALLVVCGTVLSMCLESQYSVSPIIETVVPAAIFVAALFCSYEGVAMTRCGENLPWELQQVDGREADAITVKGLALQNPLKALIWIEWRTYGRVLPAVVLCICLFTLFGFYVKGLYPIDPIARSMGGPGMIRGPFWLMLGEAIPFIAWWMAACMSGVGYKSEDKEKDVIVNSFSSVRPATAGMLIAAKFAVAARSTLLTWALIIPFIVLWMNIRADNLGVNAPLFVLLSQYCPGGMWLGLIVALIVCVLLTWKIQIDNLFLQLTEREWLKYVYWIALPLIYAAPVEIVVLGWAEPDFFVWLSAVAPTAILVAAACKCIAAAFVCTTLVNKKLVRRAAMMRYIAIWFLVVAVLSSLLIVVTSSGLQLLSLIVPLAVLIAPAVRIGLAPLELHSSRHR
jgi:hypothetical protein